MRKYKGLLAGVLAGIFMCGFIPAQVFGADVNVYAEGAYTADGLDVYIFADAPATELKSFGVKLLYNSNELQVATAQKNETSWYMGDGSTNYPYMDPETATAGEVVIIGGKLDTATPLAGESGDRILLGEVHFTRVNSGVVVTDPATYFSISLSLGKDGNYANFVNTDGIELDDTGVAFVSTQVCERGDANADGVINGADRSAVKYYMVNGGTDYCWMDCNGDGTINGADRSCIKYIMTN